MSARVSPRTTASAAAHRQLRADGYFHGSLLGTASVRCPTCDPVFRVRVVLSYRMNTRAQIVRQLRDALTDHILEQHPEVARGEQR